MDSLANEASSEEQGDWTFDALQLTLPSRASHGQSQEPNVDILHEEASDWRPLEQRLRKEN